MLISIVRRGFAVCLVGVVSGSLTVAAAQTPAQAPAQNQTVSLASPITPETAEPDFALVNIPTTRPLREWGQNFHLTHRFLGNLRGQSFTENLANAFGLDNGAVIGLEYRISPIKNVQAIVYRNSSDRTIQFSAQIDALRQKGAMPVSLSFIGSVEGNKNFGWSDGVGHDHSGTSSYKSPALSAVVSRTFEDRVAVYANPTWVHNTLVDTVQSRDTFYVGMGTRVRVSDSVYLVGEAAPRFAGYIPNTAEFAFGFEKRQGGHMFLLTLTNSPSTTFAQMARGGFPTTLYFGFNLGRKFL